ncbi:Hypothetical_protein [Hexamita inflata]|uniref:Hypothetical_protein n=1 Tax=Hexamita inflata TaxID=28002 RepID=A0AA86NKP9_9EUKA|nr:Hypothetical protein HINF_LOCUS8525 [Hexamita inflata]CAI9939217.1 Hypothetical protein HINF_LOCUS26862 [Hexamita inflata]
MPYIHYLQKFVYKGITAETIDKVFILSQKGINQTQIATETGLGVMQVRRVVQRAIKDEGFQPTVAKGGRHKSDVTQEDVDNVKLINKVGINSTYEVYKERLRCAKLNQTVNSSCSPEQNDVLFISSSLFLSYNHLLQSGNQNNIIQL